MLLGGFAGVIGADLSTATHFKPIASENNFLKNIDQLYNVVATFF